jgi:hypothetical protein
MKKKIGVIKLEKICPFGRCSVPILTGMPTILISDARRFTQSL